jgi:hypothetical protein
MIMEERIGFLTSDQEKLLVEALDEFLKFKNAIMEKMDGPVALVVIRGVDNRFAERVHPEWKTPLIPILDKALEGDIEETRRLVTDLINQKIDIPGIQEDVELMMFDGFTRFAVAAVAWYLERKRAA